MLLEAGARQISSYVPSCLRKAAFRRGSERRIYAAAKNFVVRPCFAAGALQKDGSISLTPSFVAI